MCLFVPVVEVLVLEELAHLPEDGLDDFVDVRVGHIEGYIVHVGKRS